MHVFMRAAPALFLVILLMAPASASTKAAGPHRARGQGAAPSLDMYSHRARRRAATILQLELLEMRKAHLDRVRQVIEKRLPVDGLFNEDTRPLPTARVRPALRAAERSPFFPTRGAGSIAMLGLPATMAARICFRDLSSHGELLALHGAGISLRRISAAPIPFVVVFTRAFSAGFYMQHASIDSVVAYGAAGLALYYRSDHSGLARDGEPEARK